MELRRSRKLLIFSFILGAGCAGVLLFASDRLSAFRYVVVIGGLVLCLFLAISQLRSFRFRISPEGLDLYHRGIKRPVPWAEIDAVVLEQPARTAEDSSAPSPRLLLVPAAGSDLRQELTELHPVDGRAARVLLETDDVKDDADDIAQALTRAAGGRFTDLRGAVLPGVAAPAFTVVLRGYAPHEVDQLIRSAQLALRAGGAEQRAAARARLASPSFTIAVRGYDRFAVDAYLPQLSAQLAG